MRKIIDFYNNNCAPCQMIKKELESFDNVEYVNIMENFDKALEFQVRKVPTIIITENDKEIGRFVGFKDKQQITSYLDSL